MNKYFKGVRAEILQNDKLRDPQKCAYANAVNHYLNKEDSERESIIVLPTGVGKTGLISILPFEISEGRVLIISPQLTIKDGILNSLTTGPDNFYTNFDVLHPKLLPTVVEYNKKLPITIYEKSNIVVANIHKLQSRLRTSMLKKMSKDFFDMIIIDEGHHSAAKTWIDAVNYFDKAKIIKLTATPFRSDDNPISGEEIYNYPLSKAMKNGYIKSLENITYVPEELYLTIDNKTDKYYSIDQIRKMGLKDEDWISRSVAYSKECSNQVVVKSIELLEEKKKVSRIPHKIIAIACSVKHAEEIKELYELEGCRATIIHSKLSEKEKEENFKKIENNRVDVVINVAMLGEGYDHKYLSIAAIFRPFRNILAYTQFIGRILRSIPNSESAQDNIGRIIAHENLNLSELWGYYKTEIEKSKISIGLDETMAELEDRKIISFKNKSDKIKEKGTGVVIEKGEAIMKVDSYLDTELLKKAKEEGERDRKKIEELQKLLGWDEEQASTIYYAQKSNEKNNGLNRPDLAFLSGRKAFDSKLQDEIIPEILIETNHDLNKLTLAKFKIFKYNEWLMKNAKNNGAILAMYINNELKTKIGRKREAWEESDYALGIDYLDKLKVYIIQSL